MVARPDDGRFRCAQLRELVDCVGDVSLGEIAEHAAHEHDVSGYRAGVGVGQRGVGGNGLDGVE